ncbi:MAG: hypothetical protein AAY43_00475 [Methanosarcina sp. 795]|nr:MAG: hypothetical protein AAY43_00475 [Methanosarcina sp. 795]
MVKPFRKRVAVQRFRVNGSGIKFALESKLLIITRGYMKDRISGRKNTTNKGIKRIIIWAS